MSTAPSSKRLIRPLVRRLHAYIPGEQPKTPGLIKLNTNENPFAPTARVRKALARAADQRLRLYPDPTASGLRQRLARLHRCRPENIIVGNGSDDLLALATRAFCEPRELIQYFDPSYSLYPVLAAIHGATVNAVALPGDFDMPSVATLRRERRWKFGAALTFVTTPNAPSGRGYRTRDLDALCRAQRGVVVLDEAYADFARENALSLALKHPHVLVSRTFSKAYSLCFLRVGYFVGHPDLIEALDKVRDSYNVNGMAQVGALAALDDLADFRRNFKAIIGTRESTAATLAALGFEVCPSQTNFLFVKPPRHAASTWMKKLRERKILVRWFKSANVRGYLRITIGTEREMAALVRAVRGILK